MVSEKEKKIVPGDKLQLSSVGAFIFVIILVSLLGSLFTKDTNTSEYASGSSTSYTVSPPHPHELKFCGEKVPLSFYDVSESLDRELIVNTYYHSQTILNIKRANRYFPVIEPILRKNDIPDDFKYLALAESSFSHVVSPAGATGFWQLMEGTARDYGLEVNDNVDERYHLEKATEAACKYMWESYKIYQNWTMVAASYNVGRRGVDRQIERQGETGYYNLLFNEETARYVFRILALKVIFENPEDYNFNISADALYPQIPYEEIVVNEPISDIGAFAREHGTHYKLLKDLNPWLRDNYLNNKSGKTYTIKIPTTRKP